MSRIVHTTLILGLIAFALHSPPLPRAQAQPRMREASSAIDVATRWMFALKRGDTRVLERASAYPFELRILGAPCQCEGGKARDATQLIPLLRGPIDSADVKALEITSADVKEVAKGALPDWAKRWSKHLPKGARLVYVETSGGSSYTISYVLVIANDDVRAVWLNAVAGT